MADDNDPSSPSDDSAPAEPPAPLENLPNAVVYRTKRRRPPELLGDAESEDSTASGEH
jgi:hypothetical protein